MRTFRIYSLNNTRVWHTAVLVTFLMLYITSLVLMYLSWEFVPVDFLHPVLPPRSLLPPVATSLIFLSVSSWSVIDLQHYVSSFTQLSDSVFLDISKLISTVGVDPVMCPHAQILLSYGLRSSSWTWRSHDSVYFATGCPYLLISFTPTLLASGNHLFVLCIYNCFLFCYFYSCALILRVYIWVKP